MARKKAPEKAPNHERWLVSYGDFITLLFAVFVTLYAMSQVDKKKLDEVASSYRSAFSITAGGPDKKALIPKSNAIPIPPPVHPRKKPSSQTAQSASAPRQADRKDFKAILVALEKFLADTNKRDKADISITSRGLVISLKEGGLFDSGQAKLKPESLALLNTIAEALLPFSNQISFEGHTDNVPISSAAFPSNWELSVARSVSLAHYFMDHYAFNPANLAVIGYGEFRPVADNATEEGKRQNRRVDIVLWGNGGGETDSQDPPSETGTDPVKKLPPLPF